MILKIKEKDHMGKYRWFFIDNIKEISKNFYGDWFVHNADEKEKETSEPAVHLRNTDGHEKWPNRMFVDPKANEGRLVHVADIFKTDGTQEEIAFEEAYLLSDVGKTIEKL